MILTQPLETNYGGLLQAFALQKTIKKLFAVRGEDVIVETDEHTSPIKPNFIKRFVYFFYRFYKGYIKGECLYRNNLFNDNIQLTYLLPILTQNTKRFVEKHINTTQFFIGKNPIKNKIKEYDTYIVGSDQVFRPMFVTDIRTYFFDFLKEYDCIKIAYAASFGIDNESEFSKRELNDCKYLSKKFNAISVRESSGVGICKRCFGVDAQCVLDPTMLLTQADYETIIDENVSNKTIGKIAYYFLDETDKKLSILNQLKSILGLDAETLKGNQKITPNIKDYTNCIFPSVPEWLSGIRDCEYVITDSFHGMVVSIIFKKNFYVLNNEHRGNERIESLINILGLQDRLVRNIDDIKVKNIDYSKVYTKLIDQKAKSIEFLKKNLEI
ncbi:MAG: polysaccharide pyruvyl transferase family protein [Bacteroidales bacterium]|nr:polysaccharide pyruvyl transferase family protein [Bacteroidales bacterium]